jgi:BirA family biotin operon repressor/biotin-[acetyl-CoA-carboxylase] ligase
LAIKIFCNTDGNTGGVESQFETPPADQSGWLVSVVDETGSTNADLLRAASAGAADRTVLVARHQTAGRGRLDRRWDAPPGLNLLLSILFRNVPTVPHMLTQRVAVAAVKACERAARVKASLKWPNDLVIDGKKLAGILAQAECGVVVVGVGINVGWAPTGAARLGHGIDPLHVLRELLVSYDELPVDPWSLYREHMTTIGRRVSVEMAGTTIAGRALDVERDGRLLVVDDAGVKHRFDVGDVVHLR